MKTSWRSDLLKLTEFLGNHKEIIMRPELVQVPAGLKEEYYELFNNVRSSYLEEKYEDYLTQFTKLSNEYLKSEEKNIKLFGLEVVKIMPALDRYLRDPFDALRREVYTPLEDYLKGIIEEGEIHELVRKNMQAGFSEMYQKSYVKWFQMAFLSLLKPDSLLYAKAPDIKVIELQRVNPYYEIDAPSAGSANILEFEYDPEQSCVLANFIVKSETTGSYISSRGQFSTPIGNARRVSDKREWLELPGNPLGWQDLVLIYSDKKPEDVNLISDRKRICRPDVAVVCMPFAGWAQDNKNIERINDYHANLQPVITTYVLTIDEVARETLQGIAEGVVVLDGNYNNESIKSIIDALLTQIEEDEAIGETAGEIN